ESHSDEQQNQFNENDVIDNSEHENNTSNTETVTNGKLSDDDSESTNDITSEEEDISIQDENVEKNSLNHDENLNIEEESTSDQSEGKDSDRESTLNPNENLEIEEVSTADQNVDKNPEQENALNPNENIEIEEESTTDENVDAEIEDKETPIQDDDNEVKEENVLIQEDDSEVEENESTKKEDKEKSTDQIEGSKDNREKEQSDVISKNDETKMTPYLASTFSIKNIDKADTNTVKDVNYATKLNKVNSGLYSTRTSNKAVTANKFLNHTMFISQKRQMDGTNYYKIHNGLDGAMQGWMKESDLRLFNIYNHEKYNKTFSVSSNYRDDYLLSEPWGTSNQRVKKSKIPAVQYLKHRKRSKSEQLFIITGLSVIQQGGFRTPGCLPTYRHNTLKQTMRHESKAIETQVSIVL